MPPKSKTPKTEEISASLQEPVEEKEVKATEGEGKDAETTKVPSWRAEVVEEGSEDEKKEEEKEEEAPAEKEEQKADEKVSGEEEKVTDLTAETPSETTETPSTTESPWVEESSSPPQSEGTVTISLSKKLFWLFLFLVIAGLVVGGFFFYKSRVEEKPGGGTTQTPSSTPGPEATSTPTPSEEVKLDSYKVNILNGSGIPGEAGKVQALLEKAGFKDFKTGNADNYNYTITEVTLKEGVSNTVFDAIKEVLDEYNVVKQEGSLDKDSEFDVEIIVGAKSAAATPSPSQ